MVCQCNIIFVFFDICEGQFFHKNIREFEISRLFTDLEDLYISKVAWIFNAS